MLKSAEATALIGPDHCLEPGAFLVDCLSLHVCVTKRQSQDGTTKLVVQGPSSRQHDAMT